MYAIAMGQIIMLQNVVHQPTKFQQNLAKNGCFVAIPLNFNMADVHHIGLFLHAMEHPRNWFDGLKMLSKFGPAGSHYVHNQPNTGLCCNQFRPNPLIFCR